MVQWIFECLFEIYLDSYIIINCKCQGQIYIELIDKWMGEWP